MNASSNPSGELNLSILVTKERAGKAEVWVAQSIEHNICVQSATLEGLEERFSDALIGNFLVATHFNVEPFSNLPPAPQQYWAAFQRAQIKEASGNLVLPLPSQPRVRLSRGVSDPVGDLVCA